MRRSSAQNGRYGPYLKKGTDSRSLAEAEQLFSITLAEALELFAQPKARRGRGSVEPLKELGDDPATGKPMVLREGRFGPYVTDGETNASLRKQDTVEGLTVERAAELLADRRAAGPPVKKARGFKKAAGVKKAAGAAKKAGTTVARRRLALEEGSRVEKGGGSEEGGHFDEGGRCRRRRPPRKPQADRPGPPDPGHPVRYGRPPVASRGWRSMSTLTPLSAARPTV